MDVAFDSAALLVLGRDEALSGCPEILEPGPKILSEPDVSKHQPRLGRQVIDKLPFGGAHRFVRGFRHRQGAKKLVLVANGHDHRRAGDIGHLSIVNGQGLVHSSRLAPQGRGSHLAARHKPHPGLPRPSAFTKDRGHLGKHVLHRIRNRHAF